MNEEWWESPVCWLCNYWWALLIAIVLALTVYFTRGVWLPLVGVTPIPPTPTATLTPLPTSTRAPTPTPVSTATPEPTPTLVLGTGDVQITLQWSTLNDIDLYVTDPAGETIFYSQRSSGSGGILDVDANLGCGSNITSSPVENIFWPIGAAPTGTFRVEVEYFEHCAGAPLDDSYTVRVLVDGEVQEFTGTLTQVKERDLVYEFSR